MTSFHWIEAKQLDNATNFSTETECIAQFLAEGINAHYYCSFSKKKAYYNLPNNIHYLGVFKNKYIKFLEFRILVIFKSLQLILSFKDCVLMVNQPLVNYMRPAIFLNKVLKKENKFILDVRTLPTSTDNFSRKMTKYNRQIAMAVSIFDGLSFITPFLEKISLRLHPVHPKTVNWSSGVNMNLFNAEKYDYSRDTDKFRIFYHGGLSVSRGNLNLIKACKKVVEKGYNIELLQIGTIVDKELMEYINAYNLDSWCKLYAPKPLDEIPSLIAKCDLPILPFPYFMPWRVSSPIKLMEYWAMGKPVLAPNIECFTDIFPNSNAIISYYNGEADNTINELEKAIIKQISNFKFQSKFIKSSIAIDFVNKNFTWSKQVNNLIQFCNNL